MLWIILPRVEAIKSDGLIEAQARRLIRRRANKPGDSSC
jgi:uncharacterized membrane protein YebE (DUF533 family)